MVEGCLMQKYQFIADFIQLQENCQNLFKDCQTLLSPIMLTQQQKDNLTMNCFRKYSENSFLFPEKHNNKKKRHFSQKRMLLRLTIVNFEMKELLKDITKIFKTFNKNALTKFIF